MPTPSDCCADMMKAQLRRGLYGELRAFAARELQATSSGAVSDDRVDEYLKANLLNILTSLHALFWYDQEQKKEMVRSEVMQ